jgi:methionine aminopeptidase
VGLDLGCVVDGFYGDAAATVGVGRVSEDAPPPDARDRGGPAAGIAACHPGKR